MDTHVQPDVIMGTEQDLPFCILTQLEVDDDYVFEMASDVLTAYKRADKKVRPVPGVFPEEDRVLCHFPEDPLLSLPKLTMHPPEFIPNGRLTQERLDEMNINPDKYLWPEEEKLFKWVLQLNQDSLVFEEEHCGTL
ncbi:hypothetical protein QCA50_008504 [Cerrena zonata]|uniref:Uncharacterized protein n=1 Tax=Cerrena zonata TaxID=2478898 RepID=A0AAW0GDD5_9APHY